MQVPILRPGLKRGGRHSSHFGQVLLPGFNGLKWSRLEALGDQSRKYGCWFACHRTLSFCSPLRASVRKTFAIAACLTNMPGGWMGEWKDIRREEQAISCVGSMSAVEGKADPGHSALEVSV
jgi:hypothetical protein